MSQKSGIGIRKRIVCNQFFLALKIQLLDICRLKTGNDDKKIEKRKSLRERHLKKDERDN